MNERTLAYLTVVNYALLACLWTAILALYLRYRRIARNQDALVAVLAGVLALDAMKSAVENVFFGIVWAGNYGIAFPVLSRTLSQPVMLMLPKLLNTVVCITVLAVIVRRWIPTELRERRTRLVESQRLHARLEASLRETAANEQRWQLALDANQDGIWDWDVLKGVIWMSPRYEIQLGFAPGSSGLMSHLAWREQVHPEDRAATFAAVEAFVSGRSQKLDVEYRLRAADNSYRRILSRGAALRDATGQATRVVGSHADVTERREAEAALAARQRTESLGLLAGGIAHDFNNLLAVLQGNVSVVRAQVAKPSSDVREALDDLDAAVARASDLTTRLLAYSGRGRFVVRPVDLTALGREMARLLGSSVPSNVRIDTAFESNLPAVEADAAQMQQLWINLFTNAVDAIGSARGTVTMRTRLEVTTQDTPPPIAGEPSIPPGRYVVVEVSDDGEGMTSETRSRMFDPFFTTKTRGRGLGMSAMLGILRAHRAGVRIVTAPGNGTTFTVLLPAGTGAPGVVPESLPSPSQRPSASRRVLLADDEPLLRTTLGRMLERLGFAVDVVSNGREAIERLDAAPTPFDLVLVDLTMPEVDGRGVLAHVREKWPALPVILMSGYTEEASSNVPHMMFLNKPFDARMLEESVRRMLPGTTPAS